MANNTNAVFVIQIIGITLSTLILSSVCETNSVTNDCKCEMKSSKGCYEWVNEKYCSLMNGKLLPPKPHCDCCPVCVVYSELFEDCHQTIPGFKVRCSKGLFCSKSFGNVCIDPSSKQRLVKSHQKRIHRTKHESRVMVLVPDHQRPLLRLPRSFLGLNLGQPMTMTRKKQMTIRNKQPLKSMRKHDMTSKPIKLMQIRLKNPTKSTSLVPKRQPHKNPLQGKPKNVTPRTPSGLGLGKILGLGGDSNVEQ